MRSLFAFAFLSFIALGYAFPKPDPVKGSTTLSSPSMCKDDSGKYFIFSGGVGLEIRTSTDRTTWTFAGKVWPNGVPPWTKKYVDNGRLWAPDCTYHNGEFWLYYAASTSGSRNSAIFLAKSSTGAPGSWTHEGLVISTSLSDNYNAIDPNLLIDGDKWYLSFGSFWSGIKVLHINPSNGLPHNDNITGLAQRTADNGAMEASVIFKFKDFYYLFTSWDHCCRGTDSTYNIRVGRSKSPLGEYVDKSGVALKKGGGTLVLGTHNNVIGPGGQDLMHDHNGPILVYHYSTPKDTFLGINRLNFSSGWPVVI